MSKSIFRLALWALLVIPTLLFILGTLAAAAYMFWPRDISTATHIDIPETNQITIISHGLRDKAAGWPAEMASKQQNTLAVGWSGLAEDPFTCSVNARRIGNALGQRLAAQSALRSLHLIAHSCGSFISYGICETLKEQRPQVIIHSTYLDPVSVYGGFFWDFGVDHFGDCADYADAYIDTADTVPGSNVPLPNTHTFDISALRLQQEPQIHPHIWPRLFYQRRWLNNDIDPIEKQKKHYPSGKTTVIATDE